MLVQALHPLRRYMYHKFVQDLLMDYNKLVGEQFFLCLIVELSFFHQLLHKFDRLFLPKKQFLTWCSLLL